MNRNLKTAGAVVLAGVLFAAGGMGAATAKDWIDGSDLKPGSVSAGKLSPGVLDGIKGEKGEKGARGPRGETGPQGPAGEAGTAGAEGVRGLAGEQGPQGVPGAQGPQGPQGVPGTPGTPGTPGLPGTPGTPGTPGADGADGVSGYITKFSEVRVAAGATQAITLDCGTKVALGGGWYTDNDNTFTISDNAPLFSQIVEDQGAGQVGTAHGWTLTVTNNAAGARNITALVNCASIN